MQIGAVVLSTLAALTYTAGILMLKRSTLWRPGPWRTTILCNFASALIFAPLLLLHDWSAAVGSWWQPVATGAFFAAGQLLAVAAITFGDVSIATPLLGTKILMVAAILSVFASAPLVANIWPAAVLAVIAITCLGWQPRHHRRENQRRRTALTVALSLAAAMAYAIFDSMIQLWSPQFGPYLFLPLIITSGAAWSLTMLPWLEGRFAEIDRRGWPWLAAGAILIGVQAIFLTTAISLYRDAAGVNVVYSSRGLWSVLAIILFGRFFSADEAALPPAVQRARLLGAVLMVASIALVL